MSIFGLIQVVDDQTHINQGNCHSLIDLVLMSAPLSLSSRQVVPPLSNSDHLGIEVQIKLKYSNKSVRPSSRTIWLYSHADWDKAREREREKLEEFDWDGIISEDVNHSWAGWYTHRL